MSGAADAADAADPGDAPAYASTGVPRHGTTRLPLSEEQRNVRNLIRIVGVFLAWPSLGLGLVFLLEARDHLLHIAGLLPLGVAGLVAVAVAPRLARRFVRED